jgi:1-acyl-sn-glycerol-3-phosphate acyltransferase
MTPLGALRLGSRLAASAAVTIGCCGAFDAETALSPEAEHAAIRHRWVRRWARRLLAVLRVAVSARGPHVQHGEVYPGRDARGVGRLFILNHRSGLDILVTLAHLEGHLVSHADLAGWPLIGAAARRGGTLFVDRESKRSSAAVLRAMTRVLAAGRGVCIYPEGTAFAGDEVRPLMAGAFRVAQRAGASIVPVGLAYADPGTTFGDESFPAHMLRVAAMDRIVVALEVGAPLAVEGAELGQLRQRGRAELQALVDRARARLR